MNMTPEPISEHFESVMTDNERCRRIEHPDLPTTAREIPISEFQLEVAATEELGEADIRKAVQAARASAVEWTRIAEILGLTVSEAQRRFGPPEST